MKKVRITIVLIMITMLTITAIAWMLSCSNPDGDGTVGLNPADFQYSLSVSGSPTAGGSVTVNGTTTAGTTVYYNRGASVRVCAIPASGYTFAEWQWRGSRISSSSSNPCEQITVRENVSWTAYFRQDVTLTVARNTTEGGTVTVGGSTVLGSGTSTSNTSSHNYGAQVQVCATASSGHTFTGWSGEATSTNSCVTVTMSSDRSLTANFQRMPPVVGIFADVRDRKTYRTVLMPDGKTWMAENLNYQTTDSWCYNNQASNCNTYGRLYTWSAAMNGASSSNTNPSGVQGVCPAGWHLPSDAEWEALVTAVGGWEVAGSKLKSTSGWNSGGNGTHDFGFSALPGGNRVAAGVFYYTGNTGNWWSTTEDSYTTGTFAWGRHMDYDSDRVSRGSWAKVHAMSVRCLMN